VGASDQEKPCSGGDSNSQTLAGASTSSWCVVQKHRGILVYAASTEPWKVQRNSGRVGVPHNRNGGVTPGARRVCLVVMRFLLLAIVVSCSAAPSADGDGVPPAPMAGSGGATEPPAGGAGAPGGAAGVPVAGSGGLPAGAPAAGDAGLGGGGGAPPVAGMPPAGGGPATSGAPTGGTPAGGGTSSGAGGASGSGDACPADYYCHELGPDAFAKCVIRPAPDDPQFPSCKISEGTCYWPKDAPESCIKPECWSKRRTCD
jgi:hypothetical protein